MRAGGATGNRGRFAGPRCVWRSFIPARSGADCARGGGAGCALALRSSVKAGRAAAWSQRLSVTQTPATSLELPPKNEIIFLGLSPPFFPLFSESYFCNYNTSIPG